MLGCSAYFDRLGSTHYLHSFNNLCRETSVGCEALIDTKKFQILPARKAISMIIF